ncbi:MAG: tripartite tricarboxylate transporter permease [Bacillota bacterium]
MLGHLLAGFGLALSPDNLVACFVGVLVGTLTGVLPGFGTPTAMAVLLALTFGMDPTTGIIMLAGIYYGAMYGGSTTAILVNMPGEEPAIVTTLDGYQMARRGRAGAALAVSALGSWVAGTLAVVGLMLFAPPLARLAVSFGPPEYFAIAVFGLVVLSTITSGALSRSFLMILAGLMMGTVGMDTVSGGIRFAFGISGLAKGLEFVVVAIGLLGLGEVFSVVCSPYQVGQVPRVRYRDLYPTRRELGRSAGPWLRGALVGFLTGLIPGPAGTMATLGSYALEKGISRRKEEFGKGAIEGVAGPEAANNAAGQAAFIPLLSLGIPFSPPVAVLLSGLMIHGITPGPLLISNHPQIFWGVVASMYIGNVILLILNLPLVGVFASLLRVSPRILMPVVAVVALVGAYSINNSFFDVWVCLFFGLLGFVMKRCGFEPIPMVIGLVLGPIVEQSFRQALIMGRGNPLFLLSRPVSAAFLIVSAGVIAIRVWYGLRSRVTAPRRQEGEIP